MSSYLDSAAVASSVGVVLVVVEVVIAFEGSVLETDIDFAYDEHHLYLVLSAAVRDAIGQLVLHCPVHRLGLRPRVKNIRRPSLLVLLPLEKSKFQRPRPRYLQILDPDWTRD